MVADLLGAEAALAAGPEWSVAIILPFDVKFFEKDFILQPVHPDDQPMAHPDLATFKNLMSLSTGDEAGRVAVRVLPRLKTAQGGPASDGQLDKDDIRHDKVLRREHYEQVGQFIAETAMLLVAVMDADERPDLRAADGGTARVVATRRCGQPDEIGSDVARRSTVVRNSWSALLAPPGGYVWLIDPNDNAPSPSSPPVTVLPPLLHRSVKASFEGFPGRDMPDDPPQVLRTPPSGDRHAVWSRLRSRASAELRMLRDSAFGKRGMLRDSIHPLRSFDDFEVLNRKNSNVSAALAGKAPAPASLGLITDPLAYLSDLRGLIGGRKAIRKADTKVISYWSLSYSSSQFWRLRSSPNSPPSCGSC